MIGQTISHYRIIEKLGQGGMGEVYLAEDTRLGRKVALKFLAPELARVHESLVRFRNEAKAAAELSHPNIATIHDIGDAGGKPFLVLEFLQGQTLKERIAQGPLPIEDVLRIGQALAAGLAEAHSLGIVHRDIKSANVMLTDKSEVKILDFGLAHRVDATQLTRPGTTLGTIHYMSPEQTRGDQADERSDIWSMGVVLYECLTGRLPFLGEAASVLGQIQTSEVDPPTALRTGISMELEQAVLRCLEKDPQLRYQHADDVLAKLRAVESHTRSVAIATTSQSAADSARRTSPWRTRRMILVTAIVLLVAAGLRLRSWVQHQMPPLRVPGEFTVAVIDFQAAAAEAGFTPGPTMTNLVQASLIGSSPCRVLTLEYLKDVRQRLFGSVVGPIQAEQALTIARAAGASGLVVADVIQSGDQIAVSWRLMDTSEGEALGAGRCQSSDFFEVADSTAAGIVPVLVEACGVETAPQQIPVVDITTPSEEAYRHYLIGRQAMASAQWELAQKALLHAVTVDSMFALAYFALGQSTPTARNADRIRYANRSWELRSRMDLRNRLRLEAWRASLEFRLRDATAVQREILKRWPDDRETLGELSKTLYLFWMFEEAADVASKASSLYPNDTAFVTTWASALRSSSRIGDALKVLRKHLDRNPDHTNNWDDLGTVYLYAGEPDSARQCFRRALEIDPDFGSDRGMANVAFARGQLPGAMTLLEAALDRRELQDDKRGILYARTWSVGLVQMAAMAGQLGRARLYFDRAQQFDDDPTNRKAQLAFFSLVWGSPEQALAIARELCDSDNLFARQKGTRLKARSLTALDSLESAKEVVDELLQWTESGGNLFAYYAGWVKAEIALKEGRPEDALHEVRGIATLASTWGMWDMERRELEAESLRRMGRLEEARDVLHELLRIYGGRAIAHYLLAQVYEEMEQLRSAEAEYAKFLEMWANADEGLPELEDARQRLKALESRS